MYFMWNERGMNNPTEIYEYVKALTSEERKVLEAFVIYRNEQQEEANKGVQ